MRTAVLSLLFPVVVLATSIQDIIDLRESGFSEKEILELVNQDTQYEAKDFISLKKAEFNSDFILKLKKKTEKRATDSVALSNDDLNKRELEKFQINYPRAITRLRDQTYSTPGLFAHDGKVLKRNGFDESLDAPKRDLARMKDQLLASCQFFIDSGKIDLLDIEVVLDAWLEWKVISIRNIAYKQLCREEFIPLPDDYDDPMLEAERVFNRLVQDLKLRIVPDGVISSLSSDLQVGDALNQWVELGPEVAAFEIHNLRQNDRFEEALKMFEALKPEQKAPIISYMLTSDLDNLIELADALALKNHRLKPSTSDVSTKLELINLELENLQSALKRKPEATEMILSMIEDRRRVKHELLSQQSPEGGSSVAASHILISFKGADRADPKIIRSKETARMEAERIRSLILNEGKGFIELAQKYSDCPSSYKGGDLGKFKFEVMSKPFSEAAFALEIDQVSQVVETEFGFHVIKRTQ